MGEEADHLIDRMMDEGWSHPHPSKSLGKQGRIRTEGYDPLYYHQKVEFLRMSNTTELAVELELPVGMTIWVPRSVCLNWGEGVVWVHGKTLRRSMGSARKTIMPGELENLLDDETRPF